MSYVSGTRLALVLAVATLGAACSNPTVDPAATFIVRGKALKADGMPLASTDVKLIRYFDKLKLLQPTVDALFDCTQASCDVGDTSFELGVVRTIQTGADGAFEVSVTGADIQAQGGITDEQGKVEVSNLILVIADPSDTNKKAGVYTFDNLFQQSNKVWEAGNITLWDSQATADGSNALTSGLVRFSWKAPSVSQTVTNIYRVEASGAASARLVVNCADKLAAGDMPMGNEARSTRGGCDVDGAGKLYFDVSAYSLYRFYSDGGAFTGYVAAVGVDYRYRSRFTIIGPTLPNPTDDRENSPVAGIWAISNNTTAGQGEQSLLNTAAVDDNRTTKADIAPAAKSIYVLFSQLVYVSDAGLYNAVVADAPGACVVVEFSSNGTTQIGTAKTLPDSDWSTAGRFCGATAGPKEMSAVLGFDSSQSGSAGRVGQWLRFRLSDDANVTGTVDPSFTAVHEIGLYGRKP